MLIERRHSVATWCDTDLQPVTSEVDGHPRALPTGRDVIPSAVRLALTQNAMGLLILVLGLTGCQSTARKNANAQNRWNQVRAGVKYQLATQQYEAGLFTDVVKTLAESIAQDGRMAKSYTLLAQAHLELGDVGSATVALEAADDAGLTSADLHYLHGVTYELRHQLEDAQSAYSKARDLRPDNIDYLVAHVECLVEMDRSADAQAILEEQASLALDHPRVAALAGHVAVLRGDVDRAIHCYRMALATERQSPLIAEELGRLLVQDQRYEEALSVVRPLMEQAKELESDGALRRMVASCHLALGDPVSAKAVLVGYARSHPKDAAAQLLLAKSAIATSDWLTALRAVGLAEQSAPNLNEVRLVRAVTHWKRGDLSSALSDLEALIQSNPNDAEVHCLLAEVYRALGRTDDARTRFQAAAKLDPLSAWAAAGLRALSDERSVPRPQGSGE